MEAVDVRLAVLADYANQTAEGKVNIMGIFSTINPPVLPFVLPTMYLVITYVASAAEVGREQVLEVLLMDSEARRLLGLKSALVVPPAARPGAPTEVSTVLCLNGVRFEKSDDYQFSILVGGQERQTLPLRVNEPIAKKTSSNDSG